MRRYFSMCVCLSQSYSWLTLWLGHWPFWGNVATASLHIAVWNVWPFGSVRQQEDFFSIYSSAGKFSAFIADVLSFDINRLQTFKYFFSMWQSDPREPLCLKSFFMVWKISNTCNHNVVEPVSLWWFPAQVHPWDLHCKSQASTHETLMLYVAFRMVILQFLLKIPNPYSWCFCGEYILE